MAFLEDAMGGLRHRRLLVVGSGNVGRNVVKDLLTRGASVSWCYHARAPEAVFPNGSQVPMWPMTNLRDGLRGQDAIVCAVSAADPVLTEEQASWLVPGHPVTVIDLGVPRNVASGFAAGRDNVRVVNLDDLDQWDRRHAARLQEALEVGDRVVKEHVEDYERVVSGIQTGD
jgi:glutamyl-tRNA reductase